MSDFDAADRALAVAHRDDDRPCGCDSCMDYGAEDEGVAWDRLTPARRIAIRVLDSGDDRLAPLATAIRENLAATEPPAPDTGELARPEDWPAIALALFREIPTCTGCDFDHSWDDHVIAVARAALRDAIEEKP